MHEGIYSRCVESGWGEKQPEGFELGPWMQNQAGRGRPKKQAEKAGQDCRKGQACSQAAALVGPTSCFLPS